MAGFRFAGVVALSRSGSIILATEGWTGRISVSAIVDGGADGGPPVLLGRLGMRVFGLMLTLLSRSLLDWDLRWASLTRGS
ncbi:hypothetical protein HYQ46_001190 [Verticillium longisporum]|nr:hypothetical protein HYQ46_001190 [Verticillium longisporum]